MPRTRIDPTIAPESEALIAEAASRAIEQFLLAAPGQGPTQHEAGKTGLRVQITEAGREVTTLDVPRQPSI